MSTWDDFSPFVLPFAPSCPDSVVVHNVRQAAIEFLGFTKAWAADLSPIVADGMATSFPMTMPPGAVGKKLEAVVVTPVGGKASDAVLPEPDDGEGRIRGEEMGLIAFSRDLTTLTVWPPQAAGTVIVPKMKLQPSQLSDGIPSPLFEQHAQAIANGALSKILAMPRSESVDWTDMTLAGLKLAEFAAAKATTARIVERGRSNVNRRPSTRWF